MKTFVINLERDTHRNTFMKSQLDKLEVAFDFFPGVLGTSLTAMELKKHYNDRKAYRHQCRSLVLSEIGISLTHVNIYRRMIDENIKVACIFEDDVTLPEQLQKILQSLDNEIDKRIPEVILLSPAKTIGEGKYIDKKHQIKDYKDGFYTSAYIINLAAANVLSKELYPVNDVADCWKRLKMHKTINLRAITPTLTEQDRDLFGSSTTDDINKNYSYNLIKKIKFKFCRLIWKSVDGLLAIYHRTFKPYAGQYK